MKTTKTETREQFQIGFEKKRKFNAWLIVSSIIASVCFFILLLFYYQAIQFLYFLWVFFVGVLVLYFCFLSVSNSISPNDIIKDMEEEIKSWKERIEYLQNLQKLSLEDLSRLRLIINEKQVKGEYQTAKEEIDLCEQNIKINKQKIVYLMGVYLFWKYIIRWQWLKKIAV